LEALESRWVPSTLTVLNDHDSGAGSLRAAISAAHHGDTINFAPGLAGQTITLTSGELLIKQDVTIAGPGAGQLTISGNNASRVFELSVKTKPQVTLSDLTIRDGYAPGPFGYSTDNGGGILNEGTLTVSNCNVAHNNAPEGAGILNDSGATLTVSNSTLSYNTGRDVGGGYSSVGGGIYNVGTLVIHGSTLSSNSVGSEGGAIYTFTGAVTIDNHSVLSHNTAGSGGAIYGTVGLNRAWTINDSILSDNSARLVGGAIDLLIGTLTLSRCNLTGNSASPLPGQTLATRGGAIYVGDGNSLGSTVTFSNCNITGNSATQGGGIYSTAPGYGPVTVTVKDGSSITGNTASVGADFENLGVLYLDGTSTIGVLDGNATIPI
jgi:predicted outer membrane repeat protein